MLEWVRVTGARSWSNNCFIIGQTDAVRIFASPVHLHPPAIHLREISFDSVCFGQRDRQREVIRTWAGQVESLYQTSGKAPFRQLSFSLRTQKLDRDAKHESR